jgi:hypothetical protein
MRINPVTNQGFKGRVIGCAWIKPQQRKVFKQVKPCLENLVKKKDYNLKISYPWGEELRISVEKNPRYMVIESNHPDIWISRAKEIIKNYEDNKHIRK